LDFGVTHVRRATADDVRRLIARSILGAERDQASAVLGSVTLRAHQLDAARRLAAMIEHEGGAMLAEPVGLGKTYAALAVVARLGVARVVVAIPASLREMWLASIRDTRVGATIITHEALSRGVHLDVDPDLVIVDESHRLRNPQTKRYARVAALCTRSRVLLVSATPVQNARRDLAAQLALFLGRPAWSMTDAEISRYVVRGARVPREELPRLDGPHAVRLPVDDVSVEDLLALPSPVPARDESTAAALLVFGLVHQWTSSRAALVAALERRGAKGVALSSVLETGRRPTRSELAAWTVSGDAVQLAFPEIVAAETRSDDDLAALLVAVRAHQHAVESLLHRLRQGPNPDDDRAAALRAIRRRHHGERIIAFCHYTETVRALWSRLGRDVGVAALTASGARIASGRVSRASVLDQFTPRNVGRETPRTRIDLLIATDVLSEGLNLHEASVVVHLDYPWNPARLDQRVGRVRRMGSRHAAVTVYALAPPASAERLLRIDERLRDKLRVAQRTIGVAGHILPSPIAPATTLVDRHEQRSDAELTSDVRERLRSWVGEFPGDDETLTGGPVIAAARSSIDGVVALVVRCAEMELIVDNRGTLEAAPAAIRAALDAAGGRDARTDDAAIATILARLDRWLDERFAASTVVLPSASGSRARLLALARVARALSRTPRHRRALLAPLAHAARSAAVAPLAEGAERVLDSLVEADLPDEAWLRSIAAFGELNARPELARRGGVERGRVVAVLLLVRA
jgi:superfamily II DNA or RNA helicase